MGDVKTHGAITHFVVEQCKAAVPDATLAHDLYSHVEFGNYLTDVSQFRDPPAHHGGRGKARAQATLAAFETVAPALGFAAVGLAAGIGTTVDGAFDDDAPDALRGMAIGAWTVAAAGVLVAGGVPLWMWFHAEPWAQRLFGAATVREHGELAEFFWHLNLGIAHQLFTPEGHDAIVAAFEGQEAAARAALDAGLPPIPATEVDRIFGSSPDDTTGAFTQYWPHEHLDFPYVRDAENHELFPETPEEQATYGTEKWFVEADRGLLRYLELDVDALVYQFADLERDWANMRSGAASHRREDLLRRLGHLLHAVEDYWFHSNFVENYRWRRVRAANPGLDSDDDADRLQLLGAALADGGTEDTPRNRRKLNRRLRFPVYDGPELSDLDEETSEGGTDRVFTGGFGETDIWHTLGGALENMEHRLSQVTEAVQKVDPDAAPWTGFGITLLDLLLDEERRRRMVALEQERDLSDQHGEEVTPPEEPGPGEDPRSLMQRKLDEKRDEGLLCERAHAAFTAAFELDARSHAEDALLPGPGGMLIQLMSMMQEERDASAARQAELDDEPGVDADILDRASTNGASVENIGTHSLMSKDTPKSHPFREDAVRLARHASGTVARHFVTHVTGPDAAGQATVWGDFLRAYLPFPDPAGPGWWTQLLGNPTPDTTPQPDVTTIAPAGLPGMVARGGPENIQQLDRAPLQMLKRYYDGFQK